MIRYSKERIMEIEDRATKTSQSDKKREEKKSRILKTFGTIWKDVINVYLKCQKKKRKGPEHKYLK